jgi:hypothetical protein
MLALGAQQHDGWGTRNFFEPKKRPPQAGFFRLDNTSDVSVRIQRHG